MIFREAKERGEDKGSKGKGKGSRLDLLKCLPVPPPLHQLLLQTQAPTSGPF